MRPFASQILTRTMGSRSTLRCTTASSRVRLLASPVTIPSRRAGCTTPLPATVVISAASRVASAVPTRRSTNTPTMPTSKSTASPDRANISTGRAMEACRLTATRSASGASAHA